MTNEEKAIELVKQFQSCMNNGVSMDAAVMACLMEMAEWKDNQKKLKVKNKIKCPYEPYLIVTTDCLNNCNYCAIRKKGGFTYSSIKEKYEK